ncbi:GEVED domain-containing protein [Romboutsia weinsteinii]|nr:GEVED domain-containing protein [Romboutsia weinsteinii]
MKFIVSLYNDKNSNGKVDPTSEILRNTSGYIILEDVTTIPNSHHGYTATIVNGIATFTDIGPRSSNNVFSTMSYNIYTTSIAPDTVVADSIPASLTGSSPSYIKFSATTLANLAVPLNCTKPEEYPKQLSINSNSQKTETYNYPIKYNLDLSSGATIQSRVFNDKDKDGVFNNSDTLIPNIYLTLKGFINSTTITECISRPTISTTTISNDAITTFKIKNPGTYYLYETNTPLFGSVADSVFDSEYDPPIINSLPTTQRQYKISVTSNQINTNSTISIDFGHGYFSSYPNNNVTYLSLYKNDTAPTTVTSLDIVTGSKYSEALYSGKKLNALGFNSREGLIYACDNTQNKPTKYYRIENDTNKTISEVNFLIDKSSESKWIPINSLISTMGCFDPLGNYYINQMDPGSILSLLIGLSISCQKINLNPFSLKYGYVYPFTLPSISLLGINLYPFSDWIWNKLDNKLYAFNKNSNQVVSFTLDSSLNVTLNNITTDITGILSSLPLLDKKTNIVGMIFDPIGSMYLIDSNFNLYRVFLNTPGSKTIEYMTKFSNLEGTGDGASSGEMPILIDFGNAPEDGSTSNSANYKSSLKSSSNGPRHSITNKIFLGNTVLPEADVTTEINPIDNDSLLTSLLVLDPHARVFTIPSIIYNNTGKTANLYAWLDFNTNGIFEVNECFSTTIASSSKKQSVNLSFNKIDNTFPSKKNTYLRIRLTSDNLSIGSATGTSEDPRSLGPASDGEVEDYRLVLQPSPVINCIKSVYPSASVVIGDTLTYTMTISNSGSVYVSNLVVTNTLPNSTKWVSGVYSRNNIITTIVSDNLLALGVTIPTLNPHEYIIFTYTVTVI